MRLSAEQLARMEASRARRVAGPVEVVVSGVTLRPSQRDALMEAERLAGGGLAERRKAAMLVRLVEGQLKAARDGAAVEAAIEDTLLRAEADLGLCGHGLLCRLLDRGPSRPDSRSKRRLCRIARSRHGS